MEPHASTSPAPDPGLPPVSPPTGRMFLRLFGVPALIVGGLVAALVLFSWVGKMLSGHGAGRSAGEFLRGLDDPNRDIRWRAAYDLAQQLPRDDRLAADADFALAVAGRLDRAREASAAAERTFAERLPKMTPEQAAGERKNLQPDRDYILFLGACQGSFLVPVGVPALEELARQDKGLERRALVEQRRLALWVLAKLGENLKRFDKLPPEQQQAILDRLEAAQRGEHASGARRTAEHLRRRRDGRPDALGLDRLFEQCAEADDPYVRDLTAFAMNFWSGTAAEDARMEKTLLRLAGDDGRGEAEMAGLLDEKPDEGGSLLGSLFKRDIPHTRTLVKRPGFQVQVNATIALARRGSPRVSLGMLQEMLDPPLLRERFVLQDRSTGQEQPDEAVVVNTLVNALKAAAELHRKRPEMDPSLLRPLIDRLAGDSNKAVQAEAVQTQIALDTPNKE
jgi:hypothetical protein